MLGWLDPWKNPIVEAVSDDALPPGQMKAKQLLAISQCASVCRVGRENVHEHVVVRLAVVPDQPEKGHVRNVV